MSGKIAYEAYRNHSGGRSLVTGSPIPEWDGLQSEIQDAWNTAAEACALEALRSWVHRWIDRALDAFLEACQS